MQKEEVWAQYIKKNPKFATEGASFTASGLKKFFDVTWEAAHSLGVTNGRAIESSKKKDGSQFDFSKFFGGGYGN